MTLSRLTDKYSPGTVFDIDQYIRDKAEIVETCEDLTAIPARIRHEIGENGWAFKAVEQTDEQQEWIITVAPDRVDNYDAVLYLFWLLDGQISGHYLAYDKAVTTYHDDKTQSLQTE